MAWAFGVQEEFGDKTAKDDPTGITSTAPGEKKKPGYAKPPRFSMREYCELVRPVCEPEKCCPGGGGGTPGPGPGPAGGGTERKAPKGKGANPAGGGTGSGSGSPKPGGNKKKNGTDKVSEIRDDQAVYELDRLSSRDRQLDHKGSVVARMSRLDLARMQLEQGFRE